MIKSMTGFGRGEYCDEKRNVTVEIKSVNHRYLDLSVRTSRKYPFVEDAVKNAVKEVVKRGKVDISVSVENLKDDDVEITLNEGLALSYKENIERIAEICNLPVEVKISQIASMNDVLKTSAKVEDEDELMSSIISATKSAVANLDSMRKIEGESLAKDILSRGDFIREIKNEIAERADVVPKAYAAKLKDRIANLLEGAVEIPEDRIMVEAAIFADKCNVDEELTRLDSHLDQLATIITESENPEGKKLDFLIQEMNREANTTGSKANDIQITNKVILLKAEIEKVREQVQNIE